MPVTVNNKRQRRKPAANGGVPEITNEVRLNPHNPIPLELDNVFHFSPGGNKFIPFFGGYDDCFGNNQFFVKLLEARTQSATQNACIVAKVNCSIGDGVYIDNLGKDKQPDPLWQQFVKRANTKPEGLNAVLKQVFESFYTFGNVPIEIVKGTAGGKKFLYVYVKNVLDCRKEWPDENNESRAMIVSRWFRKKGVMNLTEKFNTRIPFYKTGAGSKDEYWVEDVRTEGNTDNCKPQKLGVYRTALWLKNDVAGYDHYGLPSWVSSMIFGMLEYGGAHFNLDNIDNNMAVGGVLVLSGNVSDAETKRLARDIVKNYTGKGKAGRTIVLSSEEGIENSKYTPFNTHKDGNYIDLDSRATEKIILANEWDGALMGKAEKGTMGKGGAYLNELYQQKVKTVIKPLHRIVQDGFIMPLCEIADEWLGTKWSSYDIDIQVSNLFNDTTAATTTVDGLNAFLEIVKLVAAGQYPLEAAIKLVSARFGIEEYEAAEQLGKIIPQPTKNI